MATDPFASLGFTPTTPKQSGDPFASLGFTPTPPTKSTGVIGFGKSVARGAADLGIGVLKGAGETAQNIGNAVLAAPKKIIETITPGEKIKTGVNPENFVPKNTMQTVGKTAERVAEYFAPIGKATSGLSFGLRALARGGTDAVISAAQTGGDVDASAATGLTTGVADTVSSLLPGGKAVNKVSKALRTLAPGYAADVTMGLTGQRGEDREGASAFVPGMGTAMAGALGGVQKLLNRPLKSERIITKREQELSAIENNYAGMRKNNDYSKDAGVGSRKRVASTDVLSDAVDENGLVRTKQPGGAVEQYRKQTIDGYEGVVRKNLERLNEKVSLSKVEQELTNSIIDSGLEGDDLISALAKVKKEIEGYRLKADADGNVPLTVIHDAKISTAGGINWQTPPEQKTYRKAIASGLKKTVENNSVTQVELNGKTYKIADINAELKNYYDDLDYLESLDGKRVKGGKLGKYFAQTSGNIVGAMAGGMFGPTGSAVGTILGGELAGRIKGSMLSRTLRGITGYKAPENKVLRTASEVGNSPRSLPALIPGNDYTPASGGQKYAPIEMGGGENYSNNLGSRNATYSNASTPSTIDIPGSVTSKTKNVKTDRRQQLINQLRGEYENYTPTNELPTIEMGTVPKKKITGKVLNADKMNAPEVAVPTGKKKEQSEVKTDKTTKTYYRGGADFDVNKFDSKHGLSITTDKEIASKFVNENGMERPRTGGSLNEVFIDPKAKIATVSNIPKDVLKPTRLGVQTQAMDTELVKWARDNGFDAIDMKGITATGIHKVEKEIRIVNPDILQSSGAKTDYKDVDNKKIKVLSEFPDQTVIDQAKKDGYDKIKFKDVTFTLNKKVSEILKETPSKKEIEVVHLSRDGNFKKGSGGIFLFTNGGEKGKKKLFGNKEIRTTITPKKTFIAKDQEDAVIKLYGKKEGLEIVNEHEGRNVVSNNDAGFHFIDTTIANKLKEQGYDSIHYVPEDMKNSIDSITGEQWVVLDEKIIKKADNKKVSEALKDKERPVFYRGQKSSSSGLSKNDNGSLLGNAPHFSSHEVVANMYGDYIYKFQFKKSANVKEFGGTYDLMKEVNSWADTKGSDYRYKTESNQLISDWAKANKVDGLVLKNSDGAIFNNNAIEEIKVDNKK